MSLISVIIPTYNRAGLLIEAVSSVLDQTYSNFELIIVDDGSTDKTEDRFGFSKPPVRYIRQEHQGVSAARNRGIVEAKGAYIAFLDSDDYWLKNKLAVQVDFLKSNSEILICQTEERWIRKEKRVNPRTRHVKPSGQIFDRSLELCVVSPSSVMMHREFFQIVGIFDERLPACEDYDLWLRAAYRINIPLISQELTVKRGGHEDQLSHQLWGMDRFRVYALQKLLKEPLSAAQRKKTIQELQKKCTVLSNGALKRRRYLLAARIMLTKWFPGQFRGIIA